MVAVTIDFEVGLMRFVGSRYLNIKFIRICKEDEDRGISPQRHKGHEDGKFHRKAQRPQRRIRIEKQTKMMKGKGGTGAA
jgi:23S rRNA pseudoU1915 N3-methylase RlmH